MQRHIVDSSIGRLQPATIPNKSKSHVCNNASVVRTGRPELADSKRRRSTLEAASLLPRKASAAAQAVEVRILLPGAHSSVCWVQARLTKRTNWLSTRRKICRSSREGIFSLTDANLQRLNLTVAYVSRDAAFTPTRDALDRIFTLDECRSSAPHSCPIQGRQDFGCYVPPHWLQPPPGRTVRNDAYRCILQR